MLKEILKKEGKSNYYLSKELGINQGQLSSFLKGKKGISLKRLEQIIDHLGYEIFLFSKVEIGKKRHQKKLLEEAKVVELHIAKIIEEFETEYDVYVRRITLGDGNKIKIHYETGKIGAVSTRGRDEPDLK